MLTTLDLELRPFSSFLDTQGFQKPSSYNHWYAVLIYPPNARYQRSVDNLEYFKANYLAVWGALYLLLGLMYDLFLLC